MTSAREFCCRRMSVRPVATSKVRPASYIHKSTDHHYQRIDLNPWDIEYLRLVYMQRGLLFAKPQSLPMLGEENATSSNMISHLKNSLSCALDQFFPLAGRLGIQENEDDNTISVYIDCNFEGAEFIHATADISVEDIVGQTYAPASIIDPLFSLNGVRNYQGLSHPLLSVQITELLDGVFIACSANHSVCDGTSFWQFINSWSEISRTSSNKTPCRPSPVFERWFVKDTDCPIRLPPFSFAEERSPADNANAVLVKGPAKRCFRFTKTSIAKLKARANSDTKQNAVISSLQAALAHLWIAVLRAGSSMHATNDYDESVESTSFGFRTNNRTKLFPPLPDAYFGNATSYASVTAEDNEVLEGGFGFLASLLNEVVNSVNDGKIRCATETMTKKPFIISGEAASGIVKKRLMAVGSHRFNMYGNDFGWGRPIATKSGVRGKSNGTTVVNQGPVEGSIDMEIILPVEVFEAMEHDDEFMEAFLF